MRLFSLSAACVLSVVSFAQNNPNQTQVSKVHSAEVSTEASAKPADRDTENPKCLQKKNTIYLSSINVSSNASVYMKKPYEIDLYGASIGATFTKTHNPIWALKTKIGYNDLGEAFSHTKSNNAEGMFHYFGASPVSNAFSFDFGGGFHIYSNGEFSKLDFTEIMLIEYIQAGVTLQTPPTNKLSIALSPRIGYSAYAPIETASKTGDFSKNVVFCSADLSISYTLPCARNTMILAADERIAQMMSEQSLVSSSSEKKSDPDEDKIKDEFAKVNKKLEDLEHSLTETNLLLFNKLKDEAPQNERWLNPKESREITQYALIIGSYKTVEAARNFGQSTGLNYFMLPSAEMNTYRVVAGLFVDRELAKQVGNELVQSKNLDFWILTLK